jgi:hypothetical protein
MPRKEQIAEDSIRQSSAIELGGTSAEDLELAPTLRVAELELEAFMNEPVTIMMDDATDQNATPKVEVSVNGRRIILERGVETVVARKYVERLARAKKITYSQNLDPTLGEGINRLHRHRALDYPFSVINDPNPRGREWLHNILAEA